MKIAIIGATGMVGKVMLKVLEERNFPISELIPVASEKSVGKSIEFKESTYKVVGISDAISMKPDIALLSAGGDTSLKWAPKFKLKESLKNTVSWYKKNLSFFNGKLD